MTAEEKQICTRLGSVKYLPGSFDKRFGSNLAAIAENTPDKELSEKQREWMYRLLYKYRKQLPNTYARFSHHPHCSKKPNSEQKDKTSVATDA